MVMLKCCVTKVAGRIKKTSCRSSLEANLEDDPRQIEKPTPVVCIVVAAAVCFLLSVAVALVFYSITITKIRHGNSPRRPIYRFTMGCKPVTGGNNSYQEERRLLHSYVNAIAEREGDRIGCCRMWTFLKVGT